jgi:DNA-binding response OmpR family regulator
MHTRVDILLIEDSPSQALHIQLLLQRAGYTVLIVHSGVLGYRQACIVSPRLILLDINLPKINGFQVLRSLKQQQATRTIPVVMLTDRDRLSDVEQAFALGADGYLSKQEAADQLCATISQFMTSHTGSA